MASEQILLLVPVSIEVDTSSSTVLGRYAVFLYPIAGPSEKRASVVSLGILLSHVGISDFSHCLVNSNDMDFNGAALHLAVFLSGYGVISDFFFESKAAVAHTVTGHLLGSECLHESSSKPELPDGGLDVVSFKVALVLGAVKVPRRVFGH